MASAAQVTAIDAAPGAMDHAERRLRQLESSWSRFIDTSDISRINQLPGRWVPVAEDTIRLVDTMQRAHHATGGRFDPTCLYQLLSIGYSSSIDDPDRYTLAVDAPTNGASVHDVETDRSAGAVRAPLGVALDPGGIGKGLAADIVVTELLAAGTGGVLVSIGGDIAAAGEPPTDDGWIIDVGHPVQTDDTVTTLAVSDGGIATSSTRSRRWDFGGSEHHHLIDPTSGRESLTDLASVTVVANAGWLAEAHATSALLCGSEHVIDHLDARRLAGVAVTAHGRVTATAGLDVRTPQGLRS